MILLLNEQEVTDGVCVAVAMIHDDQGEPENVEMVELGKRRNGSFYAEAIYHGWGRDTEYTLDNQQIIDGIANFLQEYHEFNFEGLGFSGELLVNDNGTIGAKIIFNED